MTDEVQPTYVRFPVDLHAQVKAYAAANDLTMAQVIRSAVREKLTPSPAGVTFDFVTSEVRPGLPDPTPTPEWAAKLAEDPPGSPGSMCPPHPKAARTFVNAGLGLYHCGACGDNYRS